MNKATNNTIVPTLRFPEFQDKEGWEEKKILDLAVGGFSNGVFNDPKKVGSGYKLINVIDMYRDTYIDESKLSLVAISEAEFLKNRVISGDIFFTRSSLVAEGIAHSNIYMGTSSDITFDGHLIRLRPKISLVKPVFLHYLLKSNPVRTQLIAKGKVATMTTIGQSDIADTHLSIPTLPEQQKIADCLSSLDELIQTESQRLETLKKHKKGLMQQLFPAEGETVPQLRFPEFWDDGEWEETTLEQIADYDNGKAHENDISESGEYIVVNSKFISTDGEVKKHTSNAFCLAAKNDILMVLSDVPNGRAIAKCFKVDVNNKYTVNQRICKLTPTNIVSGLLFYTLNRNPYLLTFDDGVKQTNLRKDDVLNCPIVIPKNIKEQQKIADCLSSLDEQIATQSQQIETLKVHKKGLMQQLFPTIDNQAI